MSVRRLKMNKESVGRNEESVKRKKVKKNESEWRMRINEEFLWKMSRN